MCYGINIFSCLLNVFTYNLALVWIWISSPIILHWYGLDIERDLTVVGWRILKPVCSVRENILKLKVFTREVLHPSLFPLARMWFVWLADMDCLPQCMLVGEMAKNSNVENNACTNIMNASNPSDPSLVFILVGCSCSILEVLGHWTSLFHLWRVLGSNFHTSFFSIIVNQRFVFRIFEWMGYCVGARFTYVFWIFVFPPCFPVCPWRCT